MPLATVLLAVCGVPTDPSPVAQVTSSFGNQKKSPNNTAALLEELPQLQPLTPPDTHRTDPGSSVDDKVLGIPDSSGQLRDLSLQLLWFVAYLENTTEQVHEFLRYI